MNNCLPRSIGEGRSSENVNIHEIENGFQVNYSNEIKKLAKDKNSFLYDYINETYAFDNLSDALDKTEELLS
jgi:hypothetical protein